MNAPAGTITAPGALRLWSVKWIAPGEHLLSVALPARSPEAALEGWRALFAGDQQGAIFLSLERSASAPQ